MVVYKNYVCQSKFYLIGLKFDRISVCCRHCIQHSAKSNLNSKGGYEKNGIFSPRKFCKESGKFKLNKMELFEWQILLLLVN